MEQTKRRTARPPGERRRPQMSLRCTAELADELIASAEQSGRSLTQELEMALENGRMWKRLIGSAGPALLVNLISAFSSAGEARARELGITGDWTGSREPYMAGAYAAWRVLVELSPPPWDPEELRVLAVGIIAGAHYRKTGVMPDPEGSEP